MEDTGSALAVWRASSGAQGLSAARPPTRIHSPTHLLSHRPDRSTAARFQTWPTSTTSKRRSNDLTDSCWRSGPQPPLLPRAQQLAALARAAAAGGRGAEPGGPETCGDLDLNNRRRESPSSAVLLFLTCSTPHCLRNPTAAHIERRMKTLHGCTCTLPKDTHATPVCFKRLSPLRSNAQVQLDAGHQLLLVARQLQALHSSSWQRTVHAMPDCNMHALETLYSHP